MGFVSKKRGSVASLRFKGRRASILHEVYFFVFQALMVFVVLLAMFQYVNQVTSGTSFEKRFTSIDIGLLTTAVFYSPGTINHIYHPIFFQMPIDVIFGGNLVNLKEAGKDVNKLYWFLSDKNMDELTDTRQLTPPLLQNVTAEESQRMSKERLTEIMAAAADYNVFFYKTGRQLSLDPTKLNPLQLTCPVINTSDAAWESKKVFIAKVLSKNEDYSNLSLPINRIAQTLASSFGRQFSVSSGDIVSAQQAGSAITAIPADADIVIVLGDAGEQREPRSLIAYFPVDEDSLKARKLGCFLINDLLTAETAVFYSQIVPVFVDSLDAKSPLNVFTESSNPKQVMVFLDISRFDESEVDVSNTADAIYRAFQRYYDAPIPSITPVQGHTIGTPAGLEKIYSSLFGQLPAGGKGLIDTWPVKVSRHSIASCFGYRGCVLHNDGECVQPKRCGCLKWVSGRCVQRDPVAGCIPARDCPADGSRTFEDGSTQFAECLGSIIHEGIDIGGAPRGTAVVSVADGIVAATKFPDWGLVEIDHGNGLYSRYLHMDEVKVVNGQAVKKGEQIGTVGGRGPNADPDRYEDHLHFEIRDTSLDETVKDADGGSVFLGGSERKVNPLCYFSPEIIGSLSVSDNPSCSDSRCKNDADCFPKKELAGYLKYCQYYPKAAGTGSN